MSSLRLASDKSILFHVACKDFEKWIRYTTGDEKLADRISAIEVENTSDLRNRLSEAVKERVGELRSI